MNQGGKVFGIGLSKTGTTSLYAALEILGYTPATFRDFNRLGAGDWLNGDFRHDLLSGRDAATDLPVGTYFRELDARYPGSKFILTERDMDSWLASIDKQFSGAPHEPGDFHRDVRLAQYGSGMFVKDRFRRVYEQHIAAVEEHFKDRPQDLLRMNVFDGDGWQKLCPFLDKPLPDTPYPSVDPRGLTEDKHDARVNRKKSASFGRFAFVIPLVNPGNEHVADYGVVERCLRATLQSLTAQVYRDIRVVVVCHRAPEWASEFRDKVRFLIIKDHPAFAPNRNDVQIDKGMKYFLGCAYAIEKLGAEMVMPMDGDDFMQREMVRHLMSGKAAFPGPDGYIFTAGLNALLRPRRKSFALEAAYRVDGFDITCGSCRVFLSPPLLRHLRSFDSALVDMTKEIADSPVTEIDPKILDRIDVSTQEVKTLPDSLIRMLGRHVRQAPFFELRQLNRPMPAKACGHGNHDGPRNGEIHWHRVISVQKNRHFLKNFGLSHNSEIVSRPSITAHLLGYYAKKFKRPKFLKQLEKRQEKESGTQKSD